MADNLGATGTARPLTRTQLLVLRAEGAAHGLIGVWGFGATGANWWLFALLFLAPDLSFLGYLAGPRRGALVYNAAHSFVTALALLGLGAVTGAAWPVALGAILWAHIGLDRMLGFGLKSPEAFSVTHLDLPRG